MQCMHRRFLESVFSSFHDFNRCTPCHCDILFRSLFLHLTCTSRKIFFALSKAANGQELYWNFSFGSFQLASLLRASLFSPVVIYRYVYVYALEKNFSHLIEIRWHEVKKGESTEDKKLSILNKLAHPWWLDKKNNMTMETKREKRIYVQVKPVDIFFDQDIITLWMAYAIHNAEHILISIVETILHTNEMTWNEMRGKKTTHVKCHL